MMFGVPRSNEPPETSQGLRPGTPLHIFKKARHLPQSRSRAPALAGAGRVHVPRPRRDPNASAPAPPSSALRVALVLAGLVWLGAAAAEFLLGVRLAALAGLAVAWLALRWSRESPRHAAWWILAGSAVLAVTRILSLVTLVP